MQSDYYVDQPRVLVFHGRSTGKEAEDLVRELYARFMEVFVKSMPAEKLPEVVASMNPQERSTFVLLTKELPPSPGLLDSIAKIGASNNLVVLHPNPLPNVHPSVRVTSSDTELYRAVSEQQEQYYANRSFNRNRTSGAVMATDLRTQPVKSSSPAGNIGNAYMMSAMGANTSNLPISSPNQANLPLQAPPSGPPIQVCILNQRADPQYNDLINTLKGKYNGNPHIQFREFADANDMMAASNLRGAHNLLLVGGKEAPMVASRIPDFHNRGIHETVFYHPTTVMVDPNLKQYFPQSIHDYPMMDRIIADRLKGVAMHSQVMMAPQQQMLYQTTGPRAQSVPPGGNLMVSQIIDRQTVHAMTNQKFQSTTQQQSGGMAQQQTQVAQQMMWANNQGNGVRSMSAGTMRLKSARRYEKFNCLSKKKHSGVVYALDYADKSLRPTFLETIEYLGIKPSVHRIEVNQSLKEKSLLIAPYDRRRDVETILRVPKNKNIKVVMFGQRLDPDSVVAWPQVELVTNDFTDVIHYLQQSGYKLDPKNAPMVHQQQQVSHEPTSIAVLPMTPMTPMTAGFNQMTSARQQMVPLSVIQQQNSVAGSGVRPASPSQVGVIAQRRFSPPGMMPTSSVQGAPVMVQRTSGIQISPNHQSMKLLQQPLETAIQQHMVTTGMASRTNLTQSFASALPPPPNFGSSPPTQYSREWVVRRSPQTPGMFVTGLASGSMVSQVPMMDPKQMHPNPWGMAGANPLDQRATPNFRGPIPLHMSPPKNNASEINITSNQSIIDQQLGPGIRQSEAHILTKAPSVSNLPLQRPPGQELAYNLQPQRGPRPIGRSTRNQGVQEAQITSTISGGSQYSSDTNNQTQIRRRKKKKNQLGGQDELFPINEQDRRTSGIAYQQSQIPLQAPPFDNPMNAQQNQQLPYQAPLQISQANPLSPGGNQFPNKPLSPLGKPKSPILQPLAAPPPMNSRQPYPNYRETALVDLDQQFNQPPRIVVYQQMFQDPNVKFVRDPLNNMIPVQNEYLTISPADASLIPLAPPPIKSMLGMAPAAGGMPQQGPVMPIPGQMPGPIHQQLPPGYPGPLLPFSQLPSSKPPGQISPIASPPYHVSAPATPLTPPDLVESPRTSYELIHSSNDIPALNVVEASTIKNPALNYFPERSEADTISTKYYPAEKPTIISAGRVNEPVVELRKKISNRDQQNQTQPEQLQPLSNSYGHMYDSGAKYTNSTTYDQRENNHINRTSQHTLRISSNNLEGNKLSYLSQPEDIHAVKTGAHDIEYDVRYENGIKILSRKSNRASSLEYSPRRETHVREINEYMVGAPRVSQTYGTTIENRASRNYVKYTSVPADSYQPSEYVTTTNQYYQQETPHKEQRVSYVPDYSYKKNIGMAQYEGQIRSKSLDSELYQPVRRQVQVAQPVRSGEMFGVLYMCPRNSNIIHQGLYRTCTPLDKIRMYSSYDELKLVNSAKYGAVLVFPLDERRLPEIDDPNIYFVLMNTPAKGSREIAIKQLPDLKQITLKYQKAPLIAPSSVTVDIANRPSYREKAPVSPPIQINNQEYRVLLREDLRREVHLDAFIEPEHFTLGNIGDKVHRSHNYIIIVEQDDVEYIRPHKKQNDRIMVLGREHHSRLHDAHLWTREPREIEEAVKQVMSYKKLMGSPTSVYSVARPKVYYSFEHPEIEEEVSAEFGQQVDVIKYYDSNNLLSRLRQNRDDFAVFVLNRSLAAMIPQLKGLARRGKFLLYDKKGYAGSYDGDVIETPTVSAVVRAIRSLL